MVSALSTLANCSPAVAMPTMQSTTSATTRPRLRPTEEPSSTAHEAARAPGRLPDRGSWTCSRVGRWSRRVRSRSCVTPRFLP